MVSSLLATKLAIPPVPHQAVRRARLLDRLDEGRRRKLTLVSAPAGCGKTTLLAQWAEALDLPVAWVSLDERDNDPHRFWPCLIAALAGLSADAGAAPVPQASIGAPEDALAEWVNAVVTSIAGDFCLVLDDYHLVDSPSVHRSLAYLLDHSPATMHLVLAGRDDPPLPLALLRARGQLLELRASDLSFTPAEAAAFLRRVASPDLPAGVLQALQAHTEGWIAGLQLAALSLREGGDPFDLARTFAGTHRHIVDYLAEQVLQRQDPSVQRFLLDTCILERLSGPLCDAVVASGEAGPAGASQAMLERLERANLFLVPLDSDRRWYRYHQLFAEFLQGRARQAEPGRWPELHRRAARWLERQGDAAQAFEHWIDAGDLAEATRLAQEQARALLQRGEANLVLSWLRRLPPQTVRERPWLCLGQASALAVAGQTAQVEAWLQDAERAIGLSELAGSAPERELLGVVASLRAHLALLRGDTGEGCALLRRALDMLPAEARSLRSLALNSLGGVHLVRGDSAAARLAFEQALCEGRTSSVPAIAVPPALNLADIQVQQGHLRQALESLEDAVRLGADPDGRPLPIAAQAHCGIAELLYQWNDLEGAARYADRAMGLSRRAGSVEAIGDCAAALAWICHARGEDERAGSLLGEVERLLRRQGVSAAKQDWWAANVMRWRIARGEYGSAARLAGERGLASGGELNPGSEPAYLQLARLRLIQGALGEATELLGRLLQASGAAGRTGQVIHILTLQALAFQAGGERSRALETLARALALAEPEGYIRLFLDEGPALAPLLREVGWTAEGSLHGYAGALLAALPAREQGPRAPHPTSLVEPLSERELQILRLIAAGKTYQEIARELIVAVSTVQHYVKSLYPKLGVHSGLEAVARARELGLLP